MLKAYVSVVIMLLSITHRPLAEVYKLIERIKLISIRVKL